MIPRLAPVVVVSEAAWNSSKQPARSVHPQEPAATLTRDLWEAKIKRMVKSYSAHFQPRGSGYLNSQGGTAWITFRNIAMYYADWG